MLNCPLSANKAIPEEYRKIAEDLFPPNGYPNREGPSLNKIQDFAEILGLGPDYKQFLEASNSGAHFRPRIGKNLEALLLSFQNNLDLLIQKTWVEKADESRKDDLTEQVPDFIAKIEEGNYSKALEEFGAILDELAWLFFGDQSQKDDFTEYTFRIDTQFGLFWWYGNQLCSQQAQAWMKGTDKGILKAILLLGISYLTNF
jgi:hypothetical protein